MGAITVKYNGAQISPVPLVSRSYQFLDQGARFGQIEEITLSCYLTGLTTPATAVSRLTGMFADQFKTLQVFEDTSLVYQWDNTVLQEISFSKSSLPIGGFVPYTAKLLSYQTPSGILDPSNEYSFTQNEDGTVTVNHKISARGIKTSSSALDNAINFVKSFTGKDPYTFCAPSFAPNGVSVLLNTQETINRAEASYSVNETYKYNTGSLNSYIETKTLDISDSLGQDYTSLDLSVKRQGSTINSNLGVLRTSFAGYSPSLAIADYGISTGKIYQNGFNMTLDSGANTVDIKASFLSGLQNDFSGYFNYTVSLDSDLVSQKTDWKIDGEFICKGPISFRRTRIDNFKASNQASSYIPYLTNLINTSPLFAYGSFPITSLPTQLTIAENSGLATLRLSATFSDEDGYNGLIKPKYSIEMDASKWIYELIPSANIEGNYVVQDLQMKSKAKMGLSMDAGATGQNTIADFRTVLNQLSGYYMANGFVLSENVRSGISDMSLSFEVLGDDIMGDALLDSKVHGVFTNSYVRTKGFQFGY